MNAKLRKLEINIGLKAESIEFINAIADSELNITFPVMGDFIIDKYGFCKVERKNLEHDSLIYDLVDTSYNYGGASNVANILGTFCVGSCNKKVEFLLGCGFDDMVLLEKIGLHSSPTFDIKAHRDYVYNKVIPVKTRLIGLKRNEYLCRLDAEPARNEFPQFSDSVINELIESLQSMNTNRIFISDYNKGFICDDLLSKIDGLEHIKYRYCNIRPKRLQDYITHLKRSNRMHLLSFNKAEFIESYDILLNEKLDVISFDDILRFQDQISIKNLIITFGSDGFIYHDQNADCYIKVDSFKNLSVGSKNIIGAGDMVSAAFTFFDTMNRDLFMNKYSIDLILYIVNCCAFMKVYSGEYTITFDSLKSYISGNLCLF